MVEQGSQAGIERRQGPSFRHFQPRRIDLDEQRLADDVALAALDARLAMLFDTRSFLPRDWQPLPLLGIPGATADNERSEYYDDRRQFRPARTMRPGSSPGNR